MLLDRAEHDLGYRSSDLDDIATTPRIDDRLVVLTGPRRVGKSVALVDASVADAIERHLDDLALGDADLMPSITRSGSVDT